MTTCQSDAELHRATRARFPYANINGDFSVARAHAVMCQLAEGGETTTV